jgi:hypothetical protein
MSFFKEQSSYSSITHWTTRGLVVIWSSVAILVIGLCVAGGVLYSTKWEEAKTRRGRGDSPVGLIDRTEADVYEMPDDFGGLATKCVWDGYRAFTTTNDGGMFVIPDPECETPDALKRPNR